MRYEVDVNDEDFDLLPFARCADTQNGNYCGNPTRERLLTILLGTV